MMKKIQLPLQTLNLTAGFMIWVILSSLMPFIKEDIAIPPEQLAWITAIPVVLGSILRIPLGYYANVFGARKMFMASFVLLMFPVYYISAANSSVDLMVGGLFLGVSGAIFSVGVTSLPKYYPKERHGFVNGIYGAGNLGTAITAFGAPVVASAIGWSATVQLYLILLGIFLIVNFFLGDKAETKVRTPLLEQIKGVYKNEKMWMLSLFYFITFGSFVAFTVYLPNFLVTNFELDKVDAGMRTAGFIIAATLMRPVGGWLADRFHSLILLMFVFTGVAAASVLLAFAPSIAWYTVGCLTIAFCAGAGNGVIFKLVPMFFHKQAGVVNGIVSAMGGLGGFFPPLMLMVLFKLTGHYAIGFMALSQLALVSLVLVIWMFYQEKLSIASQIIHHTAEGMILTDTSGKIMAVNPAFTALTGYEPEEAIGKNPNFLKSGIQTKEFYQDMWKTIGQKGVWQGEVWNRRKDGQNYLEWLTISAIKNEAGETKQYVGLISDVTAHKSKS
ncbi:MFS transporter [Domibacillus sp. DTU_2020_1001157_1_SI_ALB_TIR_016]|uniref:nitrate/nitrite transporter n=1 Tax=Domibacillus sp. DTU_2020_1001157_1_SI_ALB_TIR_016 TaxID=3077789 RepID=UPI0028EE5A24|nr:MFS transporter [Domibacillus sp. DTU_2020_1001157_1_SI_ALB_TIR_016]WNS78416.1 MFS transporter [Domibacillus sp. DTU_2020_1001157_1_SI_ALB_TIR_016]